MMHRDVGLLIVLCMGGTQKSTDHEVLLVLQQVMHNSNTEKSGAIVGRQRCDMIIFSMVALVVLKACKHIDTCHNQSEINPTS